MRKNNYDEIRIENLEFFANHGSVSGGDPARPEIYDIADDVHGYTSWLAGRMSWSHLPIMGRSVILLWTLWRSIRASS